MRLITVVVSVRQAKPGQGGCSVEDRAETLQRDLAGRVLLGQGWSPAVISHGDDPGILATLILAPGSWVIHRVRGVRAPLYGEVLDVKARYEIPSKPWSWVLYVMRALGPPGGRVEGPPDSIGESERGAGAECEGGV